MTFEDFVFSKNLELSCKSTYVFTSLWNKQFVHKSDRNLDTIFYFLYFRRQDLTCGIHPSLHDSMLIKRSSQVSDIFVFRVFYPLCFAEPNSRSFAIYFETF